MFLKEHVTIIPPVANTNVAHSARPVNRLVTGASCHDRPAFRGQHFRNLSEALEGYWSKPDERRQDPGERTAGTVPGLLLPRGNQPCTGTWRKAKRHVGTTAQKTQQERFGQSWTINTHGFRRVRSQKLEAQESAET